MSKPYRSQCHCACHTNPNVIHIAACCIPDPIYRPGPFEHLKQDTPYFPEILFRCYPGEFMDTLVMSTFVRKQFDGVWYKIYVVESMQRSNPEVMATTIRRLTRMVWEVEHMYLICGMEEKDSLQISEVERLSRLYGPNKTTPDSNPNEYTTVILRGSKELPRLDTGKGDDHLPELVPPANGQ